MILTSGLDTILLLTRWRYSKLDENKKQSLMLQDFIMFGVGLLLFSVSVFSSILGAYALFTFMLAMVLLPLSVFDIYRIMFNVNIKQHLRRFKDDKRGLTWIWIVGLVLSLPVCAFFYWVMDYPFDLIVGTVTPIYTMTGFMASSWAAVQLIVSYLLAFCLIFSVIWIIQNSKSPGVYY